MEFLRRVPLFQELCEDALRALAGKLRRRRLPPCTPVVFKGDPSGALYLIASGRVKVHQTTPSGSEVTLKVLGPGEFFGEMSLLDGQPRSADVSTLDEAELLQLEGEALREIVCEHPAVAWTLLGILSQRLRDQNDRVEMLMTQDVTGRVADQLLEMAKSQGTLLADGRSIRLTVKLTQSDIAALTGATRERVSRTLSDFRATGAIAWDKPTGCWILCNPDALAKRARR